MSTQHARRSDQRTLARFYRASVFCLVAAALLIVVRFPSIYPIAALVVGGFTLGAITIFRSQQLGETRYLALGVFTLVIALPLVWHFLM